MKQVATKEIIIFFLLMVVLMLLQHPDMLSTPVERLSSMQERANFLHPFVYTFIFYIILLFLRFVTKKLFGFGKSLLNR